MGLFKELKDMKGIMSTAPGMMESAQQLSANAKVDAMNAAYAAAAPRSDDPASEAHRVDATATVQSAQQTRIMGAQRRCARLDA